MFRNAGWYRYIQAGATLLWTNLCLVMAPLGALGHSNGFKNSSTTRQEVASESIFQVWVAKMQPGPLERWIPVSRRLTAIYNMTMILFTMMSSSSLTFSAMSTPLCTCNSLKICGSTIEGRQRVASWFLNYLDCFCGARSKLTDPRHSALTG